MKGILRSMVFAGAVALASWGTPRVFAQPGNFDPAQFQQRMLDNIRERLDVKDDAEWNVIQPRVEKVMEVRRDAGPQGFGFFGRGGRGGRRGGNQGDNQGNNNNQGRRGRRGGFGQPSAEAEALQKAIDSNASAEEIKAALGKYRNSVKEKEASLEKAQADLQKVLTAKQEAQAVLMGLCK